ncbi:uncharacterized mitochondrial protein AtMg00810-like [Ziziphus jujuba]|uniref:Uncharacterized mitochondrial protein AtMg00810-like n=1 Tax=Ziziphus jujuba TaxID=326968 RepID=A0ABM3ZRR5_ZIZJJ|nr:uncharacterized mitochondrial protein AtMg00810-like [Ziziphus jujuba]
MRLNTVDRDWRFDWALAGTVTSGSNTSLLAALVTRLNTEFALKDLGSLCYFLGIEALPFSGGLFLSQTKYAHDLLQLANLLGAAPMATPISVKQTFHSQDHLPVNATEYRSLVGALQYLTFTRPDIQQAVNHVCQHFQTLPQQHLRVVKRIL